MTSPRAQVLFVLAVLLLAACTTPSSSPGTPVCGDGEETEIEEGQTSCLFDKDLLVETGFRCPADAPFLHEFEEVLVCHGDDDLPEGHEFEEPEIIDCEQDCDEPMENTVFVLAMVDTSESMAVADPEATRAEALAELTQTLVVHETHEMAVVSFNSVATALTGEDNDGDGILDRYFTRDVGLLMNASTQVAQTSRTSNWTGAMSTARAALQSEADRIAQLEPSDELIILWVTDGLPDVDPDAPDIAFDRQVVDLLNIESDAQVSFHTFHFSTGQADIDASVEALLSIMAEQGNGSYNSVAPDGALDLVGTVYPE